MRALLQRRAGLHAKRGWAEMSLHMNTRLSRRTALQGIALATLCASAASARARPVDAPVQIMFVCQAGNRESLVAALHVKRLAEQMRLNVATMARGVDPERRVPAFVSQHLTDSGFSLDGFRPAAPSTLELVELDYLVFIGARGDFHAPLAIAMHWDNAPPLERNWDGAWQIIIARGAKLLEYIQVANAPRSSARD